MKNRTESINLLQLDSDDLDLEAIISRSESQFEKSYKEKQAEINEAATILLNEYDFSDSNNAKLILKLSQVDEKNLKKILQRSEECFNNYHVPIIKSKAEIARNLLLQPFRVLDSKAEGSEKAIDEKSKTHEGNKNGLKEIYKEYKLIINSLIALFSIGLLFWLGSDRWFKNAERETQDTTVVPVKGKEILPETVPIEIEQDDRNNLIICTSSKPVAINVNNKIYYDKKVRLNGKGKYLIQFIEFVYTSKVTTEVIRYKNNTPLNIDDDFSNGEDQTTHFLDFLNSGIMATVKVGNTTPENKTINEFLNLLYDGQYELNQINYDLIDKNENSVAKGVTKVN